MTNKQTVKFGDICKEVKLTTQAPLDDGYERYIGLEHLDSNSLKIKRWGVVAEDRPSFTRVFKKGHILFGKRRPYLKKAAIAEFDGICSGDIIVMEPTKVNDELFPYIVQSESFWDWAIQTSSGSLSPRTKYKSLAEYQFYLPDEVGQKSILQEINKSNSVVTCIDNLNDACSRLLQNKYWEVFGEKLGIEDNAKHPTTIHSSKNVPIKLLSDYLLHKPQNGQFVKKGIEGSVVCLFLNVVDGYVNSFAGQDKREKISCSESEFAKYRLVEGDVLFNRSSLVKSGIGWPFLIIDDEKESTFDCHLIRVKVNREKLLPEYLYIYSLSPWARKYFLCVGQTTTMTTISQSEIENLPVPLPSLEIQNEIVAQFQELYLLQVTFQNHINRVSTLSSKYVTHSLGG
jgi:type I restriction enzyme S subunit